MDKSFLQITNNTKGKIKNIFNYKKPGFWVTLVAVVAMVPLGIGFLSNPKEDETQDKKTKVSEAKTVKDYAWEIVKNHISVYKDSYSSQPRFKITDSQITKLENIETFENILASPIEIWELKYKLKAKTKKVELRDGMQEIGGWLIDEDSLGKPYLAFEMEGQSRKYLGCFYPHEFEFKTLANLEMGLRIMLERTGVLPKESYGGNHVAVALSLPTGETSQLLLSQPVVQGDKGIWIVERWMNEDGTIYYEFPDTDIKIADYYKNMQEQFNNGEKLSLGDPVGVAYDFIINKPGYASVKKSSLVVRNPATAADFMETPTSHYMGYISGLSSDISGGRSFIYINRVEISGAEDIERLKELDINPEEELLDLSDNSEYKLVNEEDILNHKVVTKEEFKEYIYDAQNKKLFNVYTKNGDIIRIEEQYIP
ncbi:MAG: hypothetical protein PHP79_01265 [Clostridia bacterium]|nr:hypothetical protein [Clostridia bacterium]